MRKISGLLFTLLILTSCGSREFSAINEQSGLINSSATEKNNNSRNDLYNYFPEPVKGMKWKFRVKTDENLPAGYTIGSNYRMFAEITEAAPEKITAIIGKATVSAPDKNSFWPAFTQKLLELHRKNYAPVFQHTCNEAFLPDCVSNVILKVPAGEFKTEEFKGSDGSNIPDNISLWVSPKAGVVRLRAKTDFGMFHDLTTAVELLEFKG